MLAKINWLSLLGKAWPYIVIGLLSAVLLWSRHDLGNARDKLADEAQFRQAIAGTLESPKADGPTLLYYAGERMKEIGHSRDALKTISDNAKAAKERADAADAALKREQTENAKKFAAAQATITALQNRKATGNKDADWKAIEEDSQAAWKGWK